MSIKEIENYENGWKWGLGNEKRWLNAIYAINTKSLSGAKTEHLLDILGKLKHIKPNAQAVQKIEKELATRAVPTKVDMSTSLIFTKALSKDPQLLQNVNASNIKLTYLLNNPSLLKKCEIDTFFTPNEIQLLVGTEFKSLVFLLALQQDGERQINKIFAIKKNEDVHSYLQNFLPDHLERRINSIPKPGLLHWRLNLDRHLTPLEQKYLTPIQIKGVIKELIPWEKQGIDAIKKIINQHIDGANKKIILNMIALAADWSEIKNARYGQEFIHLVAIPILRENRDLLTPKQIPEAIRLQTFINAPLSPLLSKEDVKIIFQNTNWEENTATTLSSSVENQEKVALDRAAEKIRAARSPFYISDHLSGTQMKGLNQVELNTLVPLIAAKKDGLEALMTLHEHLIEKEPMENALINGAVQIIYNDRFRNDFQSMANLTTALKRIHPSNFPLYIFEKLNSNYDRLNPFDYLPFFLEAAGAKWDAYIDFVEKVPFDMIPEDQHKNLLKAIHELYRNDHLKHPDETTMRVVEFILDSLRRRNENDLIDIDPPGRRWIITALASDNPTVREKGVELVRKAIKGVDVSPEILTNIFKRPMNFLIGLSDLGELAGKNRGSLLSQVKERDDIEDKVATYCNNYPFALSTLFTEEGLKFLTPQQAGRLIMAASIKRGGSAEIFKIYEAADEIDKIPLEKSLIRFYLENLNPNISNPDREVIFRNLLTVLQKIYGKDFDTALLDRLYDMWPKEDPFRLLSRFHQEAADTFLDTNQFIKGARLDRTPQRLLKMHLEKLWEVYGDDIPDKALNQVLDFSLREEEYTNDLFPPGVNWVKEAILSDNKVVYQKGIDLITKIYNPHNDPNMLIPFELMEALGCPLSVANWNQLDQFLTNFRSGSDR